MADWEFLGTRLVAVNTGFLVLAILFVSLRLWSRREGKQSLQLNDWLILAALLCQIAQGVLEDVNVALGSIALRPHQGSADQDRISSVFGLPSAIIWAIPLLLLRLSILHYYTKTFTCSKYRKLCIGVAILVLTFFIAYVTVVLLNCIPISMWWDSSTQGSCLDQSQRLFITAAVNVGIDGVVLLLSIPILAKVEMPHHKKLMGFFTVMAGLGVCATAGLRLLYLSQGDQESTMNYRLTSLLEADAATIVASLPLLYPLGRRLWYGSEKRSRSPTRSHGSQQSQSPMLRRTPGSGSTLRANGSVKEKAAAPRDEKSALAWPLANVDPELGLMEKHEPTKAEPKGEPKWEPKAAEGEYDAKRTPSVEKAIHGRVSGGAKIVQLPPNAKRLSAEDMEKKRVSPQDLESEWGRMTARQIQAASWGNKAKTQRHDDIPQIDQWFEGFDS